MRTVAIIQARLGSTRLPRKVFADIAGLTALEWVVRAARASNVDQVIVATPNDLVIEACKYLDVDWFWGNEINVLSRFIGAAKVTGAKRIVRLTADCPFLDPAIINECIRHNRCAVDEWPDGMDVQVFDAAWLPLGDKEHVVPINNYLPRLHNPNGNQRDIRVTLDTEADLFKLRAIAQHLPKERPPSIREVLEAYSRLELAA